MRGASGTGTTHLVRPNWALRIVSALSLARTTVSEGQGARPRSPAHPPPPASAPLMRIASSSPPMVCSGGALSRRQALREAPLECLSGYRDGVDNADVPPVP